MSWFTIGSMKTLAGHDATLEYAAEVVRPLRPSSAGATVVTLSGDLGSGKTTFVQGAAAALGVSERVTSPTFVIENVYRLEGQHFERLIHIDAYRLQSERELERLGWNELVLDPKNLILLEWPERVAGLIPERALRISLVGAEDVRTLHHG